MPIFSSGPPTSSMSPFSPASPFSSASSHMPPATNTNIVLIAELEKKLGQEQVCKVANCSLSKVLDASGNALQIQELEMQAAEQWKRQRSCDPTTLMSHVLFSRGDVMPPHWSPFDCRL